MIYDVAIMHNNFGFNVPNKPEQMSEDLAEFRIAFMQEELNEFTKAYREHNLAEQIDALIDLVVVAMGTADFAGFDWEPHWHAVIKANMKKEVVKSADESKRGYHIDLKKPEGWKAPDHQKIIEEYY